MTGKLKTFVEAGVRMGMDIRKVFWAPERTHCSLLGFVCMCINIYINVCYVPVSFPLGGEPLNPQIQKDLCVYRNPKKWNELKKCNWTESLGPAQQGTGEARRNNLVVRAALVSWLFTP